MKALLAAALLLVGGIALAEDKNDSSPSKAPEHSTSADSSSDSNKSTAKAPDKLPTPGELIKKIKEMEKTEAKKSKFAYFDLSLRPVVEQPASFSLFGDDGSMTLRSIIDRIHQARDDKDIKGVLITLGEGGINFSQAQELRKPPFAIFPRPASRPMSTPTAMTPTPTSSPAAPSMSACSKAARS